MIKRISLRLGIALTALLALALLAMIWLASRSFEPAYQGRALTAWLILHDLDGMGNSDYPRDEAEKAIRQIGTNAIPTLLKLAMVNDSPLKKRVLAIIPDSLRGRCGLLTDDEYNFMARDGFQVLGPIAKPVIPTLIDLLNNKNPDVCVTATELLGSIGPAAEDAVPALIKRFDSADAGLQRTIMIRLGQIHERPKLVVPLLISQIEDSSTSKINRMAALIALSKFESDAKPALPAIKRLLNNPDQAIQNCAAMAVGKIETGSTASERFTK